MTVIQIHRVINDKGMDDVSFDCPYCRKLIEEVTDPKKNIFVCPFCGRTLKIPTGTFGFFYPDTESTQILKGYDIVKLPNEDYPDR